MTPRQIDQVQKSLAKFVPIADRAAAHAALAELMIAAACPEPRQVA